MYTIVITLLKLYRKRVEWDSDNDDIVSVTAGGEEDYWGDLDILGFHPYKEIVFLNAALRRAVAYHWNTSKFQDLGNIYPEHYDESAFQFAQIETSYIHTPCWMDDFPGNNLEARIED